MSSDKIKGWSLMDPKPISLYLEEHDEYITAWNGYLMPQVFALNFAVEMFGGYPTPRMREEMFKTWKRLYLSGAFEEANWDSFLNEEPDRVIGYLRKMMGPHLSVLIKDKKGISEVLQWFNND